MHLCLFEDEHAPHLFPLALTRTVGDLRVGAMTLIERLLTAFPEAQSASILTRDLLADVTRQEHPDLPVNTQVQGPVLALNQRWLVDEALVLEIKNHVSGSGAAQSWQHDDTIVAAWLPDGFSGQVEPILKEADGTSVEATTNLVSALPDLITEVSERTSHEIEQLGRLGEQHGEIDSSAILSCLEKIFVAEQAMVAPGAVLNATRGPIHIAEGARVEENAVVRGPVFLGEKSVIKAGARVDGSAIGLGCKIGGEVHESIVHSYSNKAHDGYLGNSYIGRWCNLGADTNTSNLKNDYGEVTVYDAASDKFEPSGRQFVGLFMGDHSKCAINTMFNTGTVVGVFCNLFGSGFPPRHLPDFSWGDSDTEYKLEKAFKVAQVVMQRRKKTFTEADRSVLAHIFDSTRRPNSQ